MMEIRTLEDYEGPPRAAGRPVDSGALPAHLAHTSGAWIWFAQRIAAAATLVLAGLHWHAPHSRRIQFALLAALLFHAAAGVRVLLIEYGKVSARYQKPLFGILLSLAVAVFALVYFRLL